MNKYILSIDPSLNNTGFTLWEKENCDGTHNQRKNMNCQIKWKPIKVFNYSFKKYNSVDFLEKIKWPIRDILNGVIDKPNWLNDLDLFIERGIFAPKMGKGKETLDHIRGTIFGLFNKLLTKDNLISPKQWQNWYLSFIKENNPLKDTIWPYLGTNKKINENLLKNNNKWNKELSLIIANLGIKENNWDININNDHDIAESLLIGWYVINNKVGE